MERVLILASVASMIDQFNMPNIQLLQNMGYEVHVACNFRLGNTCSVNRITELKKILKEKKVPFFQIDFDRNVVKVRQELIAYRQVLDLVKKNGYYFIHCHSPIGGVIGRLVGHQCGIKVIYTAHGFHFYEGAPIKNWIFYYPVEKFLSHYTDVLITINKEDYLRAKDKLHAKNVVYIPGVGVDLQKFQRGKIDREEKRRGLGVLPEEKMILSVGEPNERKDYKTVIEAIKEYAGSKVKYFICGKGDWAENYRKLIKKWELENKVYLLGFREDISELCQAADLFVVPSFQDGFPIALMEAIAMRIPVICSGIRENTEFVKKKEYLFDPKDKRDVIRCMNNVLQGEHLDVIAENYENLKMFNLEKVIGKLKGFYGEEIPISSWGGILKIYKRQQLMKSLGIRLSSKLLLSVGELNQNKNHKMVIWALAGLQDANVHYLLAGHGKLYQELSELSKKLNIGEQVHLLGYQSDVENLYQCADIFMFPSKREGLGLAAIEAMASGLPIITSYVHGIKDYSENGLTGYTFTINRVGDLKEKMQELCCNDEERLKMSEYNQKICVRYSVKKINQLMENLYSKW